VTEEKRIQNAIIREFGQRQDMRIWRQNTGVASFGGRKVRFGVPGQADVTGVIVGGRRLEIEVKSATGRQSKEQADYQRIIERFGGLYILARSVQDVRDALLEAEDAEAIS
jgi:hypothetical protein